MDTVISLNGYCASNPQLCAANASFRDLERVNIVIGSTKAHGYGFVLYDLNNQNGGKETSIKQVTYKDGFLNEALAPIGLPLKASEEEALIMDGEFWPKNAGKKFLGC